MDSSISLIVPFMPSRRAVVSADAGRRRRPRRRGDSPRARRTRAAYANRGRSGRRREASTASTMPTRPSQIASSSRSNPGRSTPLPERPRSSSITTDSAQPSWRARLRESILPAAALVVVQQLVLRRLPDIDEGLAVEMVRPRPCSSPHLLLRGRHGLCPGLRRCLEQQRRHQRDQRRPCHRRRAPAWAPSAPEDLLAVEHASASCRSPPSMPESEDRAASRARRKIAKTRQRDARAVRHRHPRRRGRAHPCRYLRQRAVRLADDEHPRVAEPVVQRHRP